MQNEQSPEMEAKTSCKMVFHCLSEWVQSSSEFSYKEKWCNVQDNEVRPGTFPVRITTVSPQGETFRLVTAVKSGLHLSSRI